MENFGVIICTCKFDFFLAKGCVASVRQAMGEVPITLFIDDDLEASAFARHYNVRLMYRHEVRDPWLRTMNTGWGLPKMTLLWESPYENFLYLDCDTIVWGDVRQAHLHPFDADIIIDPGDVFSRPWAPGVGTDERIAKEYFNPKIMEEVFPAFPWKKYREKLFCTGVFAAKRNCLSLNVYRRIFEARQPHPGLFSPSAEMPLLNFLIFEAEERGEVQVRRAPIQVVCEQDNQDFLRRTFHLTSSGPETSPPTPTVLHFTEPKPLAASPGFNAPMQYFREKCARDYSKIPSFLTGLYTRLEELEWRMRVSYRRNFGGWHARIRGAISRLLNRNSR